MIQQLESLQSDNEPDVMLELCSLFITNSTSTVIKICEAYSSSKIDVLIREAHALKSGASSIGAEKLAFICDKLEKSISIPLELPTLLTNLKSEHTHVCESVDRYIKARVINVNFER